MHKTSSERKVAPVHYWEAKYAATDRTWSGKPNQVLIDLASTLKPGRALDLGCGEGSDSIWLANLGWRVTGIDISATATARATAAVHDSGLSASRVEFVTQDLSTWHPVTTYGLITCCFLQSPVELEREAILSRAASAVAPGGHLLVVAHAAPPPWSNLAHGDHDFPTPEGDLAALAIDPSEWEILVSEVREREVTDPEGNPAVLLDSVVFLSRR
ncbi:class I SAM-dependent methyltransferase [Micrococcales bacterium 31B]|nr:class I SAM-dependent methyltransferase [Micrococcales bacterium 31B]